MMIMDHIMQGFKKGLFPVFIYKRLLLRTYVRAGLLQEHFWLQLEARVLQPALWLTPQLLLFICPLQSYMIDQILVLSVAVSSSL